MNKMPRRPASARLALAILLGLSMLPAPCLTTAHAEATGKASVGEALSPAPGEMVKRLAENLPLRFERNLGQAEPGVKFISHGGAYTVFLTASGPVMSLRRAGDGRRAPGSLLRMRLAGADPAARLEGRGELITKSNYLMGADPAAWRTAVSNYATVEQKNVYPGIDLLYYGNRQRLEYDFTVSPGADPARITLDFDGASRIHIDRAGDLVLSTPGGDVRQEKPFVYQEVDGRRVQVAARYVVKGKHKVGFQIARYDRSRKLVIDPVLDYSSYLGVDGSAYDMALDRAGDIYIVGTTEANDLPVTEGAFASRRTSKEPDHHSNGEDAYVLKLSRAGDKIIYATYLGGSLFDRAMGVAVDADGNVYVTGATSSTDFPTTPGAFKTVHSGIPCSTSTTTFPCADGFLTKLNPAGTALVYSTLLGGGGYDSPINIEVDSSRNAYVQGYTRSPDFPTTPGAFQTSLLGEADLFVMKMDARGQAAVYSTLLGGTGTEAPIVGFLSGVSMALDAGGNVYVAGEASSDFPTTPGAFQREIRGAFVTKLNADGTALLYSTGLGIGSIHSIAIDAQGNAHVVGTTASLDFPTKNAFQPVSAVSPMYASRSKGEQWAPMSVPSSVVDGGMVTAITVAPDDPDTIYIGSEKGIFKSTDGGQRWAFKGISDQRVWDIVVDARRPGNVYASAFYFVPGAGITQGRLFKSTDGGETWSGPVISGPLVNTVAIDPRNSDVIYAATAQRPGFAGGVFKSTDEGKTWLSTTPAFNISEAQVQDLAIDPNSPSTVYAATLGGLFKTGDGGASWAAALPRKPILTVELDPSDPSTIYVSTDEVEAPAATSDPDHRYNPRRRLVPKSEESQGSNEDTDTSEGVFKSEDGGLSWKNMSKGFEANPVVYMLMADPRSPSTLYAVEQFGTFRTTDGGKSWSELKKLPGGGLVVAVSPHNSTVYAAVSFRGNYDAFVAKLNASGSDIFYSTYLGGTKMDDGQAISVDAEGSVYVVGHTDSSDFPLSHDAFDKTFAGSRLFFDLFVVKLSKAGEMIYSSYYGGSHVEYIAAVKVGADGLAYIVGSTGSTNLPLVNPLRTSFAGGPLTLNAFVARLDIKAQAPPAQPVITSVSLNGKMLVVEGRNFAPGAQILIDSKPQQTLNDAARPTGMLTSKKAGKKVKRNPLVNIQVKNPDGGASQQHSLSRP